jgi:uroporphyrinogen decarboxylase
MGSYPKALLATLTGKVAPFPPFWFMRQAGRYLPEYRALRKEAKSFLDFCYTPAMATEATLQPIRRFGMDGAIIFSDILVVPHALGADVRFEEGKGPLLVPIQNEKQLAGLSRDKFAETLAPVYAALKLTRASLLQETTLIGFAGAPWTLACYMVEGKSSKDFAQVRAIATADKAFFSRLIAMLCEAVADHALRQIDAGAEVIQLFDSWAGVLNAEEFFTWSVAPAKQIVAAIKAKHPQVPVIGFPRQAGHKIAQYVKETAIDGISIDHSVTLEWAKKELQGKCILQGNLDPVLLAEDQGGMLEAAKKIIDTLGDKPFVFNLGHGILPNTPPENLQALCDFLRNAARS